MQNIREDTIRMSQEMPSNFQTEEMKEIPHVLYEEPHKIIHSNDMTEDEPAEGQQSAEPSAGPSAGPWVVHQLAHWGDRDPNLLYFQSCLLMSLSPPKKHQQKCQWSK